MVPTVATLNRRIRLYCQQPEIVLGQDIHSVRWTTTEQFLLHVSNTSHKFASKIGVYVTCAQKDPGYFSNPNISYA